MKIAYFVRIQKYHIRTRYGNCLKPHQILTLTDITNIIFFLNLKCNRFFYFDYFYYTNALFQPIRTLLRTATAFTFIHQSTLKLVIFRSYCHTYNVLSRLIYLKTLLDFVSLFQHLTNQTYCALVT